MGGREGMGMHLASKTGFTDRIRRGGGRGGGGVGRESDACDKAFGDESLDSLVVEVGKTTMPEGEILRQSGDRRHIGKLCDRHNRASQTGSVGGVNGGIEQKLPIPVEVHPGLVNVNLNLGVHGKVEDREEVVPELGDVQDPRKLDRTKSFSLPGRCKEDSSNPGPAA